MPFARFLDLFLETNTSPIDSFFKPLQSRGGIIRIDPILEPRAHTGFRKCERLFRDANHFVRRRAFGNSGNQTFRAFEIALQRIFR